MPLGTEDTVAALDAPPNEDPANRESGAIRAGDTIGRYLVVDRIGAGGMGVVFSAYDKELDRKIALKVLIAGGGAEASGQARLQREAQAMAKLDHANVVSVFDVGVHAGRVFVAMEFVRGKTLRAWTKEDAPRWSDVIDAYRQAGRGLSAAHAAGLVHRDFKPDNVMIDATRRVRVMDFGLVRAQRAQPVELPAIASAKILEPGAEADREMADAAMDRIRERMAGLGKLSAESDGTTTVPSKGAGDASDRASSRDGALGQSLTHAGSVIGTPAYMAPEQMRGETADARADQFSLAVAMFEGLYGSRPFDGSSVAALLLAIENADVAKPPADSSVPPGVTAALRRALAPDPEARFPSVDAMLEAIDAEVRPRPLRLAWPVGITFVAVVGATVWAAANQEAPCEGGATRAAQVWTTPRKEAILGAFEATGLPYARDTAGRTTERIDAHVQTWVADHKDACEATEVRREQSARLLDLRMACLGARLRAVDALARILERADADVVENATEAAARLPTLARCADVDALSSDVAPPEEPAVAAKVRELDERLVGVRARRDAGQYADAAKDAQEVVNEANETGYGPIVARANLELGIDLDYAGEYGAAQVALRKAALEGRASRLDDVAAQAEARLVFVAGVRRARFDQGRWWAEHAAAAARRTDSAETMATIDNNLGALLVRADEAEQGTELLRRALEEREELLGPNHPDTLESLQNLAIARRRGGDTAEAQALFDRLVERRREALGPDHPHTAAAVASRATALSAAGRHDEALEEIERALAIQRAAYGDANAKLVTTWINLGAIEGARQDFDASAKAFGHAATLATARLGDDHPRTLKARYNLALARSSAGHPDDAAEILRQVVSSQEAVLGAEHQETQASRAALEKLTTDRARQ